MTKLKLPKPKQLKVLYGENTISFTLFQLPRKTLEVAVLPTMAVEVKAPLHATIEEILPRVKRRARWILKQQREFETYLPKQPPKKYAAGETHMVLGKPYRLKVFKGEPQVLLKDKQLRVYCHNPIDDTQLRKQVQDWLADRARYVFGQRFEKCLKLKKLNLPHKPQLRILKMKTRWGSCTNEGKIILNPELIHAPLQCIDYVIVHEMCHVIEHRHNKKFYSILGAVLPDWKKRQGKLNRSL